MLKERVSLLDRKVGCMIIYIKHGNLKVKEIRFSKHGTAGFVSSILSENKCST